MNQWKPKAYLKIEIHKNLNSEIYLVVRLLLCNQNWQVEKVKVRELINFGFEPSYWLVVF